jgi:hypothetical protein
MHRGHDRTLSDIIASEFVGDQPEALAALAIEQGTKKPFSSLLIAMALGAGWYPFHAAQSAKCTLN